MGRMAAQDPRKQRRNDAISRAMKSRAEAKRCLHCNRKNALIRIPMPGFDTIIMCRWCRQQHRPHG